MSVTAAPGPTGRALVDEDERRKARTALDTCMCVEAAAGTGKTTLIVDRIEELLRSGRARPSEIAAITFTELAAAELKSRLHQRLAASDPELALQLESAQVSTIHALALAILRERPLEAGLHPGFETLDPARAEELFDELWRQWLKEQVPAPEPAAGPPARGAQMFRLALQLGLDVGALRDAARLLYDHRDVALGRSTAAGHGATTDDSRDDPGERARDLWRQLQEALSPGGPLDTEGVKGGDRLAAAIEGLRQFIQDHPEAGPPTDGPEGADDLAYLGRLWAWAHTLSGAPALSGSVNVGAQANWRSKEALLRARQSLQGLKDGLEGLRSAAGRAVAEALVGWLGEFVAFAQEEKRRRGVVDFLDQLLRCRDLLRDEPAVRAHFQARWAYVVVDEFQDTDPLQAEIVFYLAERGARSASWEGVELGPGRLFVVGDPKQSIYRFRRADVEMYEKAASRLENQGERLIIRQNFRTLPAIARWVNRVFGALMASGHDGRPAPPGDGPASAEDASAVQPRYVPIEPFRADPGAEVAADGAVRPGVYRLEPGEADGDERSGGRRAGAERRAVAQRHTVAQRRVAEARAIAGAIRRLVDERRLRVFDAQSGGWRAARYGDVAVLMPVFTELDVYEDALREQEVPFQVVGGRLFYERSEVRELVALLSAVDNPSDGMAVVAALRSGFFGVGDDELVRWAQEAGWTSSGLAAAAGQPLPEAAARAAPAVAAALQRIGRWHRELVRLPPQKAVRKLLDETGYEAFVGLHPGGQQALANLAKIEAQAVAMEQAGASFHGFVRWLRRRGPQGPAAAEEEDAALSGSDDDAVRVMTVHKAKGLEFPVVFVANLFGERLQAERAVVDRAQGRVELRLGPSELGLKTRGYDEAAAKERARLDAERLRLYYVAMTRARDYLVVSAAGRDDGFWKRVSGVCPQALQELPQLPVELAEPAGPEFIELPDRPGTQAADGAEFSEPPEPAGPAGAGGQPALVGPSVPVQLPGHRETAAARLHPLPALAPFAGEDADGLEAAREAWCHRREQVLQGAAGGLRVEPARGVAEAPIAPPMPEPARSGRAPLPPFLWPGSGLAGEAGDIGAAAPLTAAEEGDARPYDGTAIGQVFHVVMERAAPWRLDVDESWIDRQLAFVADTFHLSPEERALVREWLMVACSPEGQLRRRAASAEAWMAEVPFAYEEGGVIREGRIDVVGRGADGQLWAIDYKTDDLDPPDLIRRYGAQAAAYADGLSRAGAAPVEVFLYVARLGVLVRAPASGEVFREGASAR